MKILLTGGAGFIGSHTLIELTEAGHEAVVVDNLDNSSPISLKRVAKIIGKEVPFYKVDIRDREGLQRVFDEHKFDACIHFAGLKAVGESCAKPLEYYENNMNGTFVLVDVMRKNGDVFQRHKTVPQLTHTILWLLPFFQYTHQFVTQYLFVY